MLTLFGLKSNKKKPTRKDIIKRRRERKQKAIQPIATTDAKALRVPASDSNAMFSSLVDLLTLNVGVDLGTSNILVYVKGRGIVINEPSYIARYVQSKEIIAIGEEARAMVGRTPDDIEIIRPLREGVIADYNMTEYLLRYFITMAITKKMPFKPRLMICIPSGVTSVEKRALLEASIQAGARKTVLIEEPLAAALGTGLAKAKSAVAMVVDIGGGTTDIAVVCQTGVVVSQSLRLGGERFDDDLIKYLRRRRHILIGKNTAEELKKYIGTVDRQAPLREAMVSGRDLTTGLPKTIIVTTKEIQIALERTVQTIIDGIKAILEKTPPEMIADIFDHGIILTGGAAMIDGFDRLITRSLGIATYLSDNPPFSVIIGTSIALQEMNKLQDGLEDLQ